MVQVIVAKEKLDCEHKKGQFYEDGDYDVLVEQDTDFYTPPLCDVTSKIECDNDCSSCPQGKDEARVGFIFRKNFFTLEEQKGAYQGLEPAIRGYSNNRGLASGPKVEKVGQRDWLTPFQEEVLSYFVSGAVPLPGTDPIQDIIDRNEKGLIKDSGRGCMWLFYPTRDDNFVWDEWFEEVRNWPTQKRQEEAIRVKKKYISISSYANPVYSSVAGFFGRFPRFPYARPVAYNRDEPEQFAKSFPFLHSLSEAFREHLPNRWQNQKDACDKLDQHFVIPDSVFTTITVNRTFQTSYHLDAGDLNTGFSNLTVVTDGESEYTGGYLVLPEYRTAINIRPGDLLLVANHDIIHGNTKIEGNRVSIVAYFREDLLDAGSWEYERARFDFTEGRKNNPDHPLQRKLWNGVSPGMFESKEWYDYLEAKLGKDALHEYHPNSKPNQGATLW